jgi:hypothetical protein
LANWESLQAVRRQRRSFATGALDELYWDVLRENRELFGKSPTGARYASEAQARDAYLRYLDSEQRGSPELPLTPQEQHEKNIRDYDKGPSPPSPFEARSRDYQASHGSPAARAKDEYMANRATVKAEDDRFDKAEAKASFPAKGSPTDEEEAMHAQWSSNQAAERDEMAAEYEATATAEEASSSPDDGEPPAEG